MLFHDTLSYACFVRGLHPSVFLPKAARNCLVSKNNEVKVSDFGMTRYVHEDQFFKLLHHINVTVSHSMWSVSTVRTLDLFLMISTRAHSAPSSLSSGQPQRSSDTANSAPSLTSGRSVSLGARLPFSCLVCISDSLVRALTVLQAWLEQIKSYLFS